MAPDVIFHVRRYPRLRGELRRHGVARLHIHNKMHEFSVTRDVVERLGWARGDLLIYAIRDDYLVVRKLDPEKDAPGALPAPAPEA